MEVVQQDSNKPASPASVYVTLISICIFLACGLCEIGGSWLVWKGIKEGYVIHVYFYTAHNKYYVYCALHTGGILI